MSLLANSRLALVATPIVSLAVGFTGVAFLGWDWRQVLVFYWLYNITAGVLALIDIARSDASILKGKGNAVGMQIPNKFRIWLKLGMGTFFTLHYSVFTVVHGMFLFSVLDGAFTGRNFGEPFSIQPLIFGWAIVSITSIVTALLLPATQKSINTAMSDPYKRIVVMHVTIIVGVAVIVITGLPAAAALLLVVLNAVVEALDVRNQLRKERMGTHSKPAIVSADASVYPPQAL